MISLTFDTDYMSEPLMKQFLSEIPVPGRATFFLWSRCDAAVFGDHEVAPHPTFTGLGGLGEQLDRFVADIGFGGVGVRSHSCVFSHQMAVDLVKRGYRYTSVASLPDHPLPQPFRQPWGLWELPIYYMDYADMAMACNWPRIGHVAFDPARITEAVEGAGTYVFAFHPLHLALNTPSMACYAEAKRRLAQGCESPLALTYPGRGARTFYLELVQEMRRRSMQSVSCRQIVEMLDGASGAC